MKNISGKVKVEAMDVIEEAELADSDHLESLDHVSVHHFGH